MNKFRKTKKITFKNKNMKNLSKKGGNKFFNKDDLIKLKVRLMFEQKSYLTKKQRLDNWLYRVRLVKTSSQEKEIILDDCVHINKVKTFKPSNKVTQDDIITIRKRENTFVVRFSELADKRLGFKNAISLYERIL
ncbi:MAG: hypothetical protein CML87_01730 [Rhodobiaceae bacterium]|jgi:ribosomal 50S subunit-recycling heat shock protein|nr:hypothetical protein [Rhodobiaceae bacterium]|tara:strand:+ start:419 stop:823 length:405 start_codon:yes stop_codon:yes gene_type:complete